MNDELKHHGILGMKWGKWNAETAARYMGRSAAHMRKALENKMSTANEKRVKKAQERKEIKAEGKRVKQEQKDFDKETRKRYGLSSKQYKQLRETTLNSNDPSVVKKGMHLLTDSELESKIQRLDRESKIRNLATVKETSEAKARKERNEARQKTLSYQLANKAGNMALDSLKSNVLDPGSKEVFKRLRESAERSKAQYDKSLAKQEQHEKKKQEKQERKAEERKAQAAKATENTIATLKKNNGGNYSQEIFDRYSRYGDTSRYRKLRKESERLDREEAREHVFDQYSRYNYRKRRS